MGHPLTGVEDSGPLAVNTDLLSRLWQKQQLARLMETPDCFEAQDMSITDEKCCFWDGWGGTYAITTDLLKSDGRPGLHKDL